jgi:GDPmannose 4,6-dehydratase
MWLILQQDRPEDFVIATGQCRSVEEFARLAFAKVGLDWKDHVTVDERFYRPVDVVNLCGDASKAKKVLGWQAEVTFSELVNIMVQADVEQINQR